MNCEPQNQNPKDTASCQSALAWYRDRCFPLWVEQAEAPSQTQVPSSEMRVLGLTKPARRREAPPARQSPGGDGPARRGLTSDDKREDVKTSSVFTTTIIRIIAKNCHEPAMCPPASQSSVSSKSRAQHTWVSTRLGWLIQQPLVSSIFGLFETISHASGIWDQLMGYY